MEVMRMFEKEVKKFKIGDRITLGRYTATAMAQDETGTTFCLDQVYGEKPMAYGDRKRIKALYNSKMFDKVRDLMVSFYPELDDDIEPAFRMLRSPTAEEIRGRSFIPPVNPTTIEGANKRWEAMKDVRNRIGFNTSDVICSYWVDSFIGDERAFFFVDNFGVVDCKDSDQLLAHFRPVFKLKG